MSRILFHRCLLTAFVVLIFVNCSTNRKTNATCEGKLFSLTNAVMDGQSVQVVKSTFGLGILPRRTDLTIRFGTNGSLNVSFNQTTLKPESILLRTAGSGNEPGQWVWDINADGMPDLRQIVGQESKQLYYMGKWYYYQVAGTNSIITFEGKAMTLFFNGTTWCENTNQPMVPKSSKVQEAAKNNTKEVVPKY